MAANKDVVEQLSELNKAYKSNRLGILVGAGASQQAGFPNWKTLEENLLRAYLDREYEAPKDVFLSPVRSHLGKLVVDLHTELGQGSTDLVKNNTSLDEFHQMLGKALYGKRSISMLPIPALHRQIASMKQLKVYTANYDPLLELAICRVRDGKLPELDKDAWRDCCSNVTSAERSCDPSRLVYHLHGVVEPDGTDHGTCVVTEEQYHRLSEPINKGQPANRFLTEAISGNKVLLIVGMSLTDRNLKRILFEGKTALDQGRIFAVLKEEDEVVQAYQQLRWKPLNVQFIWVRNYDEMDGLLRQIKYGPYEKGKVPRWVAKSLEWLKGQKLTEDEIFSRAWQESKYKALLALREQIALCFPQIYGEELNLNFLLPLQSSGDETKLHLVARTDESLPSDASARDRAKLHGFGIKFKEEQGSSGASFVLGRPTQGSDNNDLTHPNIDSDTILKWRDAPGYRFWRSIISIPISDSNEFVPVAVISITSNATVPFWERFGDKHSDYMYLLKQILRGAAKTHLLKNPSAVDPTA